MQKTLKTLLQVSRQKVSPQNNFCTLIKGFEDSIPKQQAELREIREKYGTKELQTINLGQVIGGMRGIKGLFSDISSVDPQRGITFRGYSIPDIQKLLPKFSTDKEHGEPLPEAIYWLLLTGEIPNKDDVETLRNEWQQRGTVTDETVDFILKLPRDIHPMTMLSMSLLYIQRDSHFFENYQKGLAAKKDYWKYFFEDSQNLIAKINRLAAIIYRHKYKDSHIIEGDKNLDWAGNYCQMMGHSGEVIKECIRGYLTIHSDHEGGNVSAHTTHLVGSALADPYLSYSAGVNGLAGPLHGLANQEVLKWVLEFREKKGDNVTKEDIESYVDECIKGGKVVPGYGHAVLRFTDPRFTHQKNFAMHHLKNDKLVQFLHKIADVIPGKLQQYGKIANPWPNVDAGSGVLLYALGLKEFEYYTVVFAVSRALGCMANLNWSRALGLPIERPGSIDIRWIKNKFGKH